MGDRRISPYVQLHAFRSRYLRLLNYATIGLQEDVQLGHDVYLRLYPAFQPLSNRNMLGVFSSAAYTLQLGTGFVRAASAATIELAGPGNTDSRLDIPGPRQSDAEVEGDVNLVSPDLGLGRFVSSASLVHVPTRYLKRYAYGVGGTDRLRGYKPGEFVGAARLVINNEFRTRPLRLYSVLAGLSLFYDMGDAQAYIKDFELKHGAGIGLRLLFPQLDRDVFRIDLSFPLQGDQSGEYAITAGFGQVFGAYTKPSAALLTQ
jgi:hemolysin activation/secretion protein